MIEPKRKGRKTTEEEVQDWLRKEGLSLDDIPKQEFEVPSDPEELFEEFKRELYVQMKKGELKSTGLVNGLKAVADMAKAWREANPPEVVVDERGIDDILLDVGLPRERRIDLGRQEIDQLRGRIVALELVVAKIEGEA